MLSLYLISEAKGFVPQHILVPYSAAHQPSAKTLPIQRFPSNNTSSLIDLSSPVQTDLPSLNQKHLEDMKDIEFQPTTAVSSSLNFRYSTAPQTPYYSTVSAAVVQRPVMPVQPIITKPADPFGEIYQKAKVDVLTNKPNLSLAPSSRPSSTCFQQSQLVNTTSQGWHRSNSFTNAIEMSSSHQTTELTSHPPLPQPLSTVFVRDEGAQPLQRTNETTNVATTQQQKDIRRTIGGSVRYHNSRETATAVLPKSVSADKFTNSTAVPVRPAPAPPQLSNPVRDSLTTESTLSSPDISAPGPEVIPSY